MLLTGDFNAQEGELCIDSFLYEYNLKNLIKEKTCFKNPENPSCIDLFLTNSPLSFQNSRTMCIGLSDCHKMILTVFKTTFPKTKPKETRRRCLEQSRIRIVWDSFILGCVNLTHSL